jgi:hypothetical protein
VVNAGLLPAQALQQLKDKHNSPDSPVFLKKLLHDPHEHETTLFLRVPQNNGSGDKDKVKDFDSVRPVR